MARSNGAIKNRFCRPPGRKILTRMVVALALPIITINLTPLAFAGIANTAHEFKISGQSGGQMCHVCHTPSKFESPARPLWNHKTTSLNYKLYGSASLDSTPGQPEGVSKLCLSCHDGTMAFDKTPDIRDSGSKKRRASAAINLSASHPISMEYNTRLARVDGNLWDPSSKDSGLGGTIDAVLLYENKVECSSCHNVHENTGNPHLLVKNNTGSALCLICHKM